MRRLVILIGCLMLAVPAMATSSFSKAWKAKYYAPDDVAQEFKDKVKSAGCYVCHVKGEDKKKVRNEYGQAVQKYLKAKDFPKDYLKENPEEAKEKILAGFKKANELKSKDGEVFGTKIKNNELPATDSGKD